MLLKKKFSSGAQKIALIPINKEGEKNGSKGGQRSCSKGKKKVSYSPLRKHPDLPGSSVRTTEGVNTVENEKEGKSPLGSARREKSGSSKGGDKRKHRVQHHSRPIVTLREQTARPSPFQNSHKKDKENRSQAEKAGHSECQARGGRTIGV